MKHSVTVTVGNIAGKIIAVELITRGKPSSASVEQAIRCYLNGKDAPGPGWAYPSFLRGRRPVRGVSLHLDIDSGLWEWLSGEAMSQDVTVPQLLEHALLYFAAEDNAGRVTERILEDLEEEEEEED